MSSLKQTHSIIFTNSGTGVFITGNEEPIIRGLPNRFICSATDISVTRIEWQYRFFGFTLPLDSADNVNQLSLDHIPSSVGTFTFICLVTSSTGEEYEARVTFKVKGELVVYTLLNMY